MVLKGRSATQQVHGCLDEELRGRAPARKLNLLLLSTKFPLSSSPICPVRYFRRPHPFSVAFSSNQLFLRPPVSLCKAHFGVVRNRKLSVDSAAELSFPRTRRLRSSFLFLIYRNRVFEAASLLTPSFQCVAHLSQLGGCRRDSSTAGVLVRRLLGL